MSWGYFADLRCTLPARAWTALKKKKPSAFPLDEDWSGIREPGLLSYFAPLSATDSATPFGEVLEWPVFREECLREETRDGANVHVRVALALERSQLELAAYLGALLAAVESLGGDGKLALINDGTYVGEDGHELVVRGGKRSKRALRDYHARRVKLLTELYPELDEEELESSPIAPPAAPVEESNDANPVAAMSESVALYNQGSPARARDRIEEFLVAGGTPTRDLMSNYTVFLRMIPPKREGLGRAHERVLGVLAARDDLRAHVPLLENAVAFLNETGRAAESIDLVLRAIGEGAQWTSALAVNTTFSAAKANDPTRVRAVVDALKERVFESDPLFLENWAALHLVLGEPDIAMRAVERALSIAPERREHIANDPELAPLRTHPRWRALVG